MSRPKQRSLDMYAIYSHPSDFPSSFVVRRWTIDRRPRPDIAAHAIVGTLGAARKSIPAGLVNVGREPGDDSVIVEVWL